MILHRRDESHGKTPIQMLFDIASQKNYVWKANLDEQGRITHLLLCPPGGIKLALDFPTVNNFDLGSCFRLHLQDKQV